MTQAAAHSDRHTALVAPVAPVKAADHRIWGQLRGSSDALAICESARAHQGLTLVITRSTEESIRLEQSMRFYLGLPTDEDQPAITPDGLELLSLPDWETLPYDLFSPHQDITSRRIRALHRLPTTNHGVLVVPARTLMHRLPPVSYLQGNTLLLEVGQSLDIDNWRMQLESAGYRHADNVYEHGEYAVRGAILDIFPMGATRPYRIDLFDDEIETLRTFDPETQRSIDRIERIELLPANEFPWHKEARSGFRNRWFEQFPHADKDAPIYQDVTHGITPPGIEYYLPLFFDQTATLFDYLPGETLVFTASGLNEAASAFDADTRARYEDRRHDRMRPILPPAELFLQKDELFGLLKGFPRVTMTTEATESSGGRNCQTDVMPDVAMDGRAADPAGRLKRFISEFNGRVLICAESSGRREALIENLADHGLKLSTLENWQAFVSDPSATLGITVAPMEYGLLLPDHHLALITETALFGERVLQRRRREKPTEADDAGYRDLSELRIGAPVVHIDHGVGRYQGLETITVEGEASEFLMLEYAGGSKLYVPVSSLHLISRYTGSDTDHAPLHKLGTDRWSNAKQKALEKIRDTAAELLDVYARREARKGFAFEDPKEAYRAFAAGFPFEETPDQQAAIEAVFEDMVSEKPMDRLVCGDVGFGKTEVAMRAAFMATYSGKQVAVLVPTTLLAQQHYESFRDRFSDTAVHVELLSRFRSGGQTTKAMAAIEAGKADIVIGTHKLLQGDIKFKNLGLVIIDEEHRFGVQQKERLKALRAEVDMLNLTATPIPRTLNMAMGHLRDLSIIATPPARRLSVKTFVRQRDEAMVKEAILREVLRGGQVYFLHNDVATIEKTAEDLRQLIPEARVGVAHGQMRERASWNRSCRTSITSASTCWCAPPLSKPASTFPAPTPLSSSARTSSGLAQLHQLRGRVGRSHHQAYAYLLTPPPRSITADAKKRLEAISEAQDLGAGFMLATHDLEIRGAGELLGEEQSGQIESIGFTLYMQLLDEAVAAIRDGRTPNAELPLSHGTEMNLRIPALIPEDYLPDVHNRLMLYKRIASVNDKDGLKELQVEMIDRFGLLPEPAKNLIRQSELRIHAEALGIVKVDAGKEWARLDFGSSTPVDPLVLVKKVQSSPDQYRLEGANSFRFRLKDASTSGKLDGISDMLGQLAS